MPIIKNYCYVMDTLKGPLKGKNKSQILDFKNLVIILGKRHIESENLISNKSRDIDSEV